LPCKFLYYGVNSVFAGGPFIFVGLVNIFNVRNAFILRNAFIFGYITKFLAAGAYYPRV